MPLESSAAIGKPTPKRTMFVAREDGRLYAIDFSEKPQLDDPGLIDWTLSVSKILIGKFQLSRTRWVTLDELEFENTTRTDQFPPGSVQDLEVTVFNTLDGRNASATVVQPFIAQESGGLLHMDTRLTGQNFSVQLRGVFNLSTIIFTSHQNGRR